MLHFDRFSEDKARIGHDAEIGKGVRIMYDADSRMECTVRRSVYLDAVEGRQPTLLISGRNRAPEDWLGLEIDLPDGVLEAGFTARSYPVHRLFPRVHYETGGKTTHIDLPDVAAADSFATRIFNGRQWLEHRDFSNGRAKNPRLTVLIPSTPWFTFELRDIYLRAAHA